MANVTVNFTDRTLPKIRDRGLSLLKARIGEFAYNDAVATGVAPGMIDVVAWFHEQNAHYYDRRRRNSLLFLADTVESMRILTRAQGYRMRPATAASVAVLAEPDPPQPASITLPAGTKLQAGDLSFELVNPATIPPSVPTWPDGTTDDVIVLTEGITRTDRFVSDGEPFQTFPLTQPGTIDGSVLVTVLGEVWEEVPALAFVEGTQQGRDQFIGDGADSQEFELSLRNAILEPTDEDALSVMVFPAGQGQDAVQVWQQVDAFTSAPLEYIAFSDINGVTRVRFGLAQDGAAPNVADTILVLYLITGAQKRYQLTFDELDTGSVRFGNGLFGVIPAVGADIVVNYRVGGGVRGNVAPNTIDQTVQGTLPSGARTPVRLRNVERGSGGEPPETIEHARFFASRFAKSNQRAVRKEDWVALSSTFIDPVFGAPSHANAFLKQKVPELNTVVVAVWGRDDLGRLSTPGTPLKVGIKRFLDTRRTFTTTVEMQDGEIIIMDVEVQILLDQGQTRQVVFAAVTVAINRFFDSAFVRPGIDFPVGGLYQAIEDVDGVDRAEIVVITGTRLVSVDIGVGDGSTKAFSGDFVLEDGTVVVVESVVVTDAAQQVVDDGEGSFIGDVDTGGTNTVLYNTGAFTATFLNPPPLNAVIQAEAKLEVFFATTEDIGTSDGSVQTVDGGTTFFPIIKRGPRGVWSGDQTRTVDATQVGASDQFRGVLPANVIPSSLSFTDSSIPPQVVIDNGVGVLTQAGPPVGTVGYASGAFNFTFAAAVVLPVRAAWSTRTVDVFIPPEFLPLTPGRLFFWGGFSADGAQVGGAELLAFDDGDGNMVGDVLAGGVVVYSTGRVTFEWNTDPPPGIAGGATRFGHLRQTPDGVLRVFDFDVGDAPGGFPDPTVVDLSRAGDDGEGRTRLALTDLSTPGFSLSDAYDNWQGGLQGMSLDNEGSNVILYSPSGINGTANGTLTLEQPLPVGVKATGSITTVVPGSIIEAETFTIDDGINTPVTFEFDKPPDGVGGGNVAVDISTAVTADDVRDAIIAAITGVGSALAIDAVSGGSALVNLTHRSSGLVGNVAITEGVVDAGFIVTGMSGGSGTPQEFVVQVTNVGVFMVAGWVFRVKTPGAPGLDKSLFADNNGRLWGDNSNAFPTDRLDHLRGRFIAQLAGSPIAAGRTLELTYDALSGVPPVRDIPLGGNQVAVVGRIKLTEKAPEVEGNA